MTNLLNRIEKLIRTNPQNTYRHNIPMMIRNIEKYMELASNEVWEIIQDYLIGIHSLSDLCEMKTGSLGYPNVEEFIAILEYATTDIRIIRFEEEGKTLEAYVKMLMLSSDQVTVLGLSIAGTLSACRSIHALMYSKNEFTITNYFTGDSKTYKTNRAYRRVEEIHNKVCHTFLLPRLSLVQEYNEACMEADANKRSHPDKIIISRSDNIEELAGQFIAQKYNLPKTKEWANLYLSLLPKDKWYNIDVIKTDMANKDKISAMYLSALKEEEVLSIIDQAIINGTLNVFSSDRTKLDESAKFTEGMTTEDYLRENAEFLSSKIDQYLKPLYDNKTFKKYLGMTNRICLPAQARAVMAMLYILKNGYSAFLTADMGCGKTQMALSLAYLMNQEKKDNGSSKGVSVLITAPAITIPKWAGEEIPTVLGSQHTIVKVLNSTEDALNYVRDVKKGKKIPKGMIEFVLVSTDRMKLTASKFISGAIWSNRRKYWCCPDCYQPIKSPKGKDGEAGILATWKDLVESPQHPPDTNDIDQARELRILGPNGLPKSFVRRYTPLIRQISCTCQLKYSKIKDTVDNKKKHCSLARPALKSRGEDRFKSRWMIAEILQKHLRSHFSLGIFDEIQQMKASNSGRGLSFHKLLRSCKKAIFLTGTLTTGVSSSIQATLWRSEPGPLIDEGFEHTTSKELWAQKYGVLERVTYLDNNVEGNAGRTTNRRAENIQIKEKPGIAPQLVAKHLLHKAVFVELSDLGLPLVNLREEPVIVDMDEEHAQAYITFERELFDTCTKLQSDLGSKAWSVYASSLLNYAAQPTKEMCIEFLDDNGGRLAYLSPPTFPVEYLTSAERELIETVRSDIALDRGSIIYTHFTNKFKTNERIQKILSEAGIESVILDKSTTSSMGRFEWLEEQKRLRTKVLIMNASLVQVGLDLLEWPNLNFWQLNDDINAVRQAGRRAWRIGQTKECTVRYFVNKDTHQMKQFAHLMKKRISALLVEGRIERSDKIAEFGKDNESALTRDLASSLSAAELTETWKSAAEKDMNENLQLVSEEEYPKAIAQAFKVLTQETKRLCGVPDRVNPLDITRVITEAIDITPVIQKKRETYTPAPEDKITKIDLLNYKLSTTPIRIKSKSMGDVIKDQLTFDF